MGQTPDADLTVQQTPGNLLPGMNSQVALGYNMFKGDIDNSLVNQVFRWTFEEGNAFGWNGNSYAYPDQVSVHSGNACSLSYIETTSTSTSYSSTLSGTADSVQEGVDSGDVTMGVEYEGVGISSTVRNTAMFGSGSSSSNYEEQESSKRTRASISRVNAEAYGVKFQPFHDDGTLVSALNKYFVQEVKLFAANPTKEQAKHFWELYGTHYLSDIKMGGYAERTAYYEESMDFHAIKTHEQTQHSSGIDFFFLHHHQTSSEVQDVVNTKGETSTAYTSGTKLVGGNVAATTENEFCGFASADQYWTPVAVQISSLAPLDPLFDLIEGVPAGTGAKMHEFIRLKLKEGTDCARTYDGYELVHPWTEGFVSDCRDLGCHTEPGGVDACKAGCTNNFECNVVSFCPAGADCTWGLNRCCHRQCSGGDYEPATYWNGWDIYVKTSQDPSPAFGLCEFNYRTLEWSPATDPVRCVSPADLKASPEDMPYDFGLTLSSPTTGRKATLPGWAYRTGGDSWRLGLDDECAPFENGDLIKHDSHVKSMTYTFNFEGRVKCTDAGDAYCPAGETCECHDDCIGKWGPGGQNKHDAYCSGGGGRLGQVKCTDAGGRYCPLGEICMCQDDCIGSIAPYCSGGGLRIDESQTRAEVKIYYGDVLAQQKDFTPRVSGQRVQWAVSDLIKDMKRISVERTYVKEGIDVVVKWTIRIDGLDGEGIEMSYIKYVGACIDSGKGAGGRYSGVQSAANCMKLCSAKPDCYGVSYAEDGQWQSACHLASTSDRNPIVQPCGSSSRWDGYVKSQYDDYKPLASREAGVAAYCQNLGCSWVGDGGLDACMAKCSGTSGCNLINFCPPTNEWDHTYKPQICQDENRCCMQHCLDGDAVLLEFGDHPGYDVYTRDATWLLRASVNATTELTAPDSSILPGVPTPISGDGSNGGKYDKIEDVSCRIKLKIEKHGVKRTYKTRSFAKAKAKCDELGRKCAAVVDKGCDGMGKYTLCKNSTKDLKPKAGTCMYIKLQ